MHFTAFSAYSTEYRKPWGYLCLYMVARCHKRSDVHRMLVGKNSWLLCLYLLFSQLFREAKNKESKI